jgi:GNAT superfamily N-acetyltransferase
MTTTIAIRSAEERDLDALATFEAAIAEVSFGDDAVTDLTVHRGRLAKALERDRASMFVAVDAGDRPIGWLWFAVNTNFLTGARYANFRSLAVSPGPDSGSIGEALVAHALDFARREHLTEVVGRVHVANGGMRVLYRKMGFEPVHLTMRRRLTGEDPSP